MPIRKIAEIKLKAGPYGRLEAVGSGFKFYSYDKDSAAIDFYFREQNGSPTDILGCTTELVLLTKEDGQQKKLTIIDSEVEIISALKGHARYVIPDRLRGYVGLVQGYVYLNFPDESRTDECRFDFTIERSLIEEEFENGGDYYIKDIQVIFDEVKDTLNSKIPEMQTKYDDLVKTFTDYANEKIAEYDSRFVTLSSNLLTLQDSLTTAQNKVTTLEQSIATANTNLNTRINEINKKIDDNDVFTKAESSANVAAQIDARNLTNAWSWSADGTDRFTKVYPRENLITGGWTVGTFVWTSGAEYNATSSKRTKFFEVDGNTQYVFSLDGVLSAVYVFEYDASKTFIGTIEESQVRKTKITTKADTKFFRLLKLSNTDLTEKLKCEVGDTPTIYTPAPSDDPINAYPTYKGQRLADSNDPADYDWQYTDEYVDYLIANNHVENLATLEEAEAGTDTTKTMTPATTAQSIDNRAVTLASNQTIGGIKNFKDGVLLDDVPVFGITRNVVFDDVGIGGYFNAVDKISLGAVGKIDKVVLVWSRVDDSAGTLLNYSWSQTVLFPDDIILGNSYRVQLTSENYKFITFKNESGILTISGSNDNSVAPNRIYRIKRIVAYIKK